MQETTIADLSEGEEKTIIDKRDEKDYTVKKINGQCWITQNLRIRGTISATDSNFTGSDFNVSEYDLKTDGGVNSVCGYTDGYNNPCSRVPDSSDMSTIGSGVTAKEVGAWYNYYATTVGTISTNSNSTVASSDICPSGWHLPTGAINDSNSEFYKLFQSTSTNISPNDYLTAFNAVKSGIYNPGSLYNAGYGSWWSTTATGSSSSRYNLYFDSSNGKFGNGSTARYSGHSIRCVRTV